MPILERRPCDGPASRAARPCRGRPLEHLQITVRIAERRDRATADVVVYGNGFSAVSS